VNVEMEMKAFSEAVTARMIARLGGTLGVVMTDTEREALETCAAEHVSECSGFDDRCGPSRSTTARGAIEGLSNCAQRPGAVRARSATRRAGRWRGSTIADAWLFDAQHEHAVIASFTRFALQLLTMALRRAWSTRLRVAPDEREHAAASRPGRSARTRRPSRAPRRRAVGDGTAD
jgi:hypothetical protein